MNLVFNFNACCNVCIQFDIAACFNSCFQFVCIIYNGWLFLCSRFCRFGQIQCLYHFAYRSIRRGIGRTVCKEEFQIQQVVQLTFLYQQLFLFGQCIVCFSGCLHLCQQSVCVGILGQAVKQRQTCQRTGCCQKRLGLLFILVFVLFFIFTAVFAFNNGNILRIAFPFRKCHEATACNHCHTQHDGQRFL